MRTHRKVIARCASLFAAAILCLQTTAFAAYDSSGLDATLKKYVQNGAVNYRELRRDNKALDAYVAGLRVVKGEEYNNWSMASKKAFWINAFHAIALKQVVDHYPCEAQTMYRFARYPRHSSQNIEDFYSKKKFRIMDDLYSLDLILNLVLRIRMHDVKTLFAAALPARGGIKLRSSVYEGPFIKEQLEEQIKQLIADPAQFHIDRASRSVTLPEFFQKYGDDFIPLLDRGFDAPTQREKETAVREFIMDYVSKEDAEFLKDPTITLIYTKFDWTLNEKAS